MANAILTVPVPVPLYVSSGVGSSVPGRPGFTTSNPLDQVIDLSAFYKFVTVKIVHI